MIILLITNKKVFNYLEYNIEVEEVFQKVDEEWVEIKKESETYHGRYKTNRG